MRAQTAAALEATYGVIGTIGKVGSGQVSAKSEPGTMLADALQSSIGAVQPIRADQTPANDLLVEVRALRDEVAQLRSDNNAGHAATAGNTGAMKKTLDNVTGASGGDAVSVVQAA